MASEVRPEDIATPVTAAVIQQAYDDAGNDTHVCFSQGVEYRIDAQIQLRNDRVKTSAHGAIFYDTRADRCPPLIDLNSDFNGSTAGTSIARHVYWEGGVFAARRAVNGVIPDNLNALGSVFDIHGIRSGGIKECYFHGISRPITGSPADTFSIVENYFRNYHHAIAMTNDFDGYTQDMWITRNTFSGSRNLNRCIYTVTGSSYTGKHDLCENDLLVSDAMESYFAINVTPTTFDIAIDCNGTLAFFATPTVIMLNPTCLMIQNRYSNVHMYKNNAAQKFGSLFYSTTGCNGRASKTLTLEGNATEQATGQRLFWIADKEGLAMEKVRISDHDLASAGAEAIWIDSLGESSVSVIKENEFTSSSGDHITVGNLEANSKLCVEKNKFTADAAQKVLDVGGTGRVLMSGNIDALGSVSASNLYVDPNS